MKQLLKISLDYKNDLKNIKNTIVFILCELFKLQRFSFFEVKNKVIYMFNHFNDKSVYAHSDSS